MLFTTCFWICTQVVLENALLKGSLLEERLNVFVVVAVVDAGVPGCVGVSGHLHQRDVSAESRHVQHGAHASDPRIRRRRVGQRAEGHSVRLRRCAAWRAAAAPAQRAPHALVRELFGRRRRRRWPATSAELHLLLHRAQDRQLGRRLTGLLYIV